MNLQQIVILGLLVVIAVVAGFTFFGDKPGDASKDEQAVAEKAVELAVRAPDRNPETWDTSKIPGGRKPVRSFTTEEGVHVQVLREGKGDEVKLGRPIDLRTRLFLLNGVMLEDGVRPGWVYGRLLPGLEGFNAGLAHIRPDEVRRILVPNELAHGNRQVGNAPAMADVVYEVRWTLFQYTDLREGSGKTAKDGSKVRVFYRGTKEDGSVFDQTKPGTPATFTLKRGSVIDGFRFGIRGMKEGGERRMFVPSNMAYGPEGHGKTIGPHTNLIFLVELLEVLE